MMHSVDSEVYKIVELLRHVDISVSEWQAADLLKRISESNEVLVPLSKHSAELEDIRDSSYSDAEAEGRADATWDANLRWRQFTHFLTDLDVNEDIMQVGDREWEDAVSAWFRKKVFSAIKRAELCPGPRDLGEWDEEDQ